MSVLDRDDPAYEGLKQAGRFGSFQQLMGWRVDNIILVSSLYESFILAEEGHLNELILDELLGMNLRHIPDLFRVPTGAAALDEVQERPGQSLVISSFNVGDMGVEELAERMQEVDPGVPVVLLAFDPDELRAFQLAGGVDSPVDRAFLWQGDIQIVLAMVKYVEDRMNAEHDVGEMGVQAIILVEDNVRFCSSFLPLIYRELMEHTRGLIPDGVNLPHRLLRARARPKILLCETFEQAWEYFETYQQHVLGVISDIEFPYEGEVRPDAGFELARRVLARQDDVPVLLQSGREENAERARAVGGSFVLKGSPTLLEELREFMLENFGFGDFVFRLKDGSEVARAHDLRSLEETVREVPAESLQYHGGRNHFSVWLKAHTEFAVASELRPRKVDDFENTEHLRQELIRAIRRQRHRRSRATIADFDAETWDPESGLARIGGGSLGGKARGLAFVNLLLLDADIEDRWDGIRVRVPPCVVLGTDVFEEFLRDNDLRSFAVTTEDDEELCRRFLQGRFSEKTESALRQFLKLARYPLAVRSSSLLEDSLAQPFAGIYETRMIANDPDGDGGDVDDRLAELLGAVKRVFASTFSPRAKMHAGSTSYRLEEEQMAVIIQRVVGSWHDGRYYPEFAGAAMSENFYPTGPMAAEDGVAAVALGLGPSVVEGDRCLRFCPRYPEHLVQFSSVDEALRNSQREFYALVDGAGATDDGGNGSEPRREGIGLERFDLRVAEKDGTLALLGSTYSPENDRIYDGISRPGARLVTFAPILKHGAFPLAEILRVLLEIGGEATRVPVEMEFAVDLTGGGRPHEFAVLQLRPVATSTDSSVAEIGEVDDEDLVCRSSSVLGNGKVEGLRDIVMVNRERFDRLQTREVAAEVAKLNAALMTSGVPYLLVGMGRWGSSDPFLGIPVVWDQIAGARVIVEAGFDDFRVSPSQGSHFFQNLTAHNIGYFTVNPQAGEGFVDWDWLADQEVHEDGEWVCHVRLQEPLVVRMDGRENAGVILKPEA